MVPRGPNHGKYKDESRKSKVKRYGHAAVEALDSWDGVCDLCGRTGKRPTIDHDHKTGAFRGILCYACNLALGLFGDDPERLAAAIKYLSPLAADYARLSEVG